MTIRENALRQLCEVLGYEDIDETVAMFCAKTRIQRLQSELDQLKATSTSPTINDVFNYGVEHLTDLYKKTHLVSLAHSVSYNAFEVWLDAANKTYEMYCEDVHDFPMGGRLRRYLARMLQDHYRKNFQENQ